MKRSLVIASVLIWIALPVLAIPGVPAYSNLLKPSENGNTVIEWTVVDAPEHPFGWWGPGFVFMGNWYAEEGSIMTYEITEIGDANAYLTGNLVIGNLTLTTNNSEIANNLILGISGLVPWNPGVAISVRNNWVEEENETAYAAAKRVPGNWLNGTIDSRYENITIGEKEYQCITWDFVQDDVQYGEPQTTYLAYDLETGVLVRGNSTFTFDIPYVLVLELQTIRIPQPLSFEIITLLSGLTGAILVGVVVITRKRTRARDYDARKS